MLVRGRPPRFRGLCGLCGCQFRLQVPLPQAETFGSCSEAVLVLRVSGGAGGCKCLLCSGVPPTPQKQCFYMELYRNTSALTDGTGGQIPGCSAQISWERPVWWFLSTFLGHSYDTNQIRPQNVVVQPIPHQNGMQFHGGYLQSRTVNLKIRALAIKA